MNSPEFPRTYSYAASCPACGFVTPSLGDISGSYFEEGALQCKNCSRKFDLWEAALDRLIALTGFTTSLSALGPRVTHLRIRVPANRTAELEQISGENVGVTVLWAPNEDSAAWLYLVDAIEAVSVRRYSQAIVPAHAAAEISISPIVSAILQRYSTKTNVTRLMKRELSFSSVLNVVVPLICELVGAKPLSGVVRDNLNALRRLRNDFVHEGVLPGAIDELEITRFLCAAAFGHEYGKYLRRFL
jgi:hypothetical protein